ncbi:ScyD/ScyE family protein [Nocardioides panacihumi]|uniref:ScyD/ScyE family protein n=1 Tax=Nocardioides panacihumi TaxID=400774 RepID=A0ABN2RCI5_9ACTN
MRRLQTIAGAAALTLTAGMAGVPHADAATPQRTLASGLLSPLSLAVDGNGTAYVTQNFAGVLAKVRPGRSPKVLYQSKGGNEVGGVSVRDGRVIFTETSSDAQGNPADSWIKVLRHNGTARTLAHVRGYENRKNPDGKVTYGARGISPSCASQWPVDKAGPAVYQGAKDSHPYATWQTRQRTYVADAGMNAVISVSPRGKIHTVAVLPAVPVKITAQLAQGAGIPACAVGLTYYGEPVPTDVQQAPDGSLYVTTEGGGLGEMMPLGALYRIRGKHIQMVAGGLFGAVGLAVKNNRTIFVAQLFGNEISKVTRSGKVSTFSKVNMPAALDRSLGHLYATTDVLVGAQPGGTPGGKVVRFRH